MESEIISLVVDASESAASVWKETAQATADLLKALPEGAVEGIYLLGSATRWEAAQWREDMPFPVAARKGGSFIAPICSSWQQRRLSPSAVAIIGAGEIFDLLDWTGSGAQWVLLRTGEDSLQGAQGRLPELQPIELEQVVTLLSADAYPLQPPRVPRLTGSVAQQWRVDRAGFPMVWVPPLGAFVHLFPIMKPQLEYFLAQTELPEFGDQWYQSLLCHNPRLSLSAPNFSAYERLCLTGLLPEDLAAFAAWQGPDFRSLTLREWQVAAEWLARQGLSVPAAEVENAMTPAARRIWLGLLAARQPQTLHELALMRDGVVEWVIEPNGTLRGMGRPRQQFQPGFAQSPWVPISPPRRAKIWGGRLMTITR